MKKIKSSLYSILNEKKQTLVFFLVLFIMGLVFGTIFITILDKSDKNMVTEQINTFFTSYKKNINSDVFTTLKNSLFSNILSVLGIWILGISIIGIPLIIAFIFIKGFIFGFSIGGIFATYNLKGLLLSFGYLFPHQFINLLIIFILSILSFNISLKFLKTLLLKKTMDFKLWAYNYYKLLFVSLIIIVISSFLETFLSPYILKLMAYLV